MKPLTTKFSALAFMFFCNPIFAEKNNFSCLTSSDTEKSINLQFNFSTKKHYFDSVRYEHQKKSIKLKLLEDFTADSPKGRPWYHEWKYIELPQNKKSGRYSMTISGGSVFYDGLVLSYFTYKRYDGKVFNFEESKEAITDNGCNWQAH